MKKMRVITLLKLLPIIVLMGCTITHIPMEFASQNKPHLSGPYEPDPDNDGDTKGINYFPQTRPATGNKIFIFDPTYHAWAAYDKEGVLVNTGKASGGSYFCPDVDRACKTIVGNHKIISKGGAGCISHRFPLKTHGGAPMPYCMHFSPKGYAIHGSTEIPDYNASHGCIRVTPAAAKWLNENFVGIGTTVIVLPYLPNT
ncbi:MAG: hypothetical protein A2103_01945 [Gammaproteobacteria bacterium GWF2_41_13]|nr:MAG: hypothetical protein A2103_01945 [Gammaproteobacteria bacterium GWF2_41_13]